MISTIQIGDSLTDLRGRHQAAIDTSRLRYFFGCRLKVLVVADRFLYFNDENFGLSELVATLRGMSTSLYPVTVDLAHRGNPGSARLNGATPNFVFEYDELKKYHQIWIMAAETRLFSPISDDERQAIRRFMDEGGGVFATGDHEDLGVTVGGYIPRVRSMRRWFWPNPGPNGEPVAPHGGDATRHDTNRAGHDPGFSFNDQSDDVPQTIAPRYFGGLIQSVHPVLCTPQGPIRVLPDHPHEGECVVPHNLGAHYSIGGHSEREYPDGPGGTPLPPVVIATSTMIPGAETAGKPPVPGGTFGAIGAWDGHRAGAYGRIVVDATWHHFININLIGDRDLGLPNPAVPKTMGFLHTAAGQAHYDRIRTYFTNIANWLTPRSMRRCWLHRHIWWVTQHGWFLENFRRDDLIQTGRLALELLGWLGPCERISFLHDLFYERELPVPWRGLLDPFAEDAAEIHKQLRGVKREDAQMLAKEMPEAMMGAAAVGFLEQDVSIDLLRNEIGDEEAEIPVFVETTEKAISDGFEAIGARLEQQVATRRSLLDSLR